MDRLDAMRALVLAVERGSLTAAARALRRSSASITRAIDALEARVGTTLLRRTTRSLKLTEAGERYVVVARRVLAELEEVEQASSAATAEPHGLLAITAPIAFGTLHVRPIIDDFLAAHARVRVRALLVDRNVNLVEEGIDVALRIGTLADSSLIAVGVGRVRRVVVASPDYLARHGRPRAPRDLAAHRCISAAGVAPADAWRFAARRGGRARRVRIEPVLSVNVADAAIRSAVAGAGITSVLSYQVATQLASGALVRLLVAHEPPPVPVTLLHAAGARSASVRAFIALAAPRLRAVLA